MLGDKDSGRKDFQQIEVTRKTRNGGQDEKD